jgi:hypothetical protein
MTTRCVQGGETFADDRTFCMEHAGPAVPAAEKISSDRHPPEQPPPDGACWRCGTVPPNAANTECLNPACRRSLTPPVLHVTFADGDVELDLVQSAELGRHGDHAALFRGFPNVSRRHAVLSVDANGTAWLRPLRTSNGTFLNDTELIDLAPHALTSGDTVRLAKDATGTVTIHPNSRKGRPR